MRSFSTSHRRSSVAAALILIIGCHALLLSGVSAFSTPAAPRSYSSSVKSQERSFPSKPFSAVPSHSRKTSASLLPQLTTATATTTTQLAMYNLPPSGGGGGPKDDSVISQVLGGALTIGAIVLFFASPLGGIFFAITNSLLILALITPVVLTIAFKVWEAQNTISGSCPSCGAPNQVVLKEAQQPSFCLNCGALLQASTDRKSIALANSNNPAGRDFIDMESGAPMGGGSIFDGFFGGGGEPEQPTQTAVKDKESKFKREQTVIDVEVDKD